MSVTRSTLDAVNLKMVNNTHRCILFTTVNLTPDAPRLSSCFSEMAAGPHTRDTLRPVIGDRLTVRSFEEFLDKFQPCFFYRRTPTDDEAGNEASDPLSPEGGIGEAESRPSRVAERPGTSLPLPQYEFSLYGGPEELGWKRVNVTTDHPLFRCLAQHLTGRPMPGGFAAGVDIESALWGFRPRSQENLLKKSALDFQAACKRLALEWRRTSEPSYVRDAQERFDRKRLELENAIGDDLRMLSVIISSLAALQESSNAVVLPGSKARETFTLEPGVRGGAIAKASASGPTIGSPEVHGDGERSTDASDGDSFMSLSAALKYLPAAPQSGQDFWKLKEQDAYPAILGGMLRDFVNSGRLDPTIGNLLAIILLDRSHGSSWRLSPNEIQIYHDAFLDTYRSALERFLRVAKPLFETVMSVYALFNEFPAEVRRGRPELVVTNDELSDLWQIVPDELTAYLCSACLQPANQYQDAFSFAIVPACERLKGHTPSCPPPVTMRDGEFEGPQVGPQTPKPASDQDSLIAKFAQVSKEAAGRGRVAGAPELLGLMQLGRVCGFTVLFSPEHPVVADRIDTAEVEMLQEDYAPEPVVDEEWAESGIMCVPDFICMPLDTVPVIGKTADGRGVGVEMPEMLVRSCYVAAGRIMANDNPEVLKTLIAALPPAHRNEMKVRPYLPGLSLDLSRDPQFARTGLSAAPKSSCGNIHSLIGQDKPFLVFSRAHAQPPRIASAKTLARVRTAVGDRYVTLHHQRQGFYLKRLLHAAHLIDGSGPRPNEEEMAKLMDDMLMWMAPPWYDENSSGYINGFPSKLEGDHILVTTNTESNGASGFSLILPFEQSVAPTVEFDLGEHTIFAN